VSVVPHQRSIDARALLRSVVNCRFRNPLTKLRQGTLRAYAAIDRPFYCGAAEKPDEFPSPRGIYLPGRENHLLESLIRSTSDSYVPHRGKTGRPMSPSGPVSRVTPVHTAMRNCTGDEGRSFEVGNQVLISSHRKLLSSKAMVVNVAEKPEQDSGRHDWERRTQVNRR
jgi:hypothetical protein